MLDYFKVPKDRLRRTRIDGIYTSHILTQNNKTVLILLRFSRHSDNRKRNDKLNVIHSDLDKPVAILERFLSAIVIKML
jgi:hypothetical protein